MRIPIALQLHTVRNEMKTDPRATLQAVAAMGYEGVEGNAPEGMSGTEFLRTIRDLGMTLIGSGVRVPELRNDLDGVVARCKETEVTMLMTGILGELRAANGDWKSVVQELGELCAKATERGLTICYHNHAGEFESKVDGKYGLDYLFESIPAEHLKAEIDVYWVKAGGEDPVSVMRKYAGRQSRLHIKDQAPPEKAEECPFAEIGHGTLDWDAIFAEAQRIGIEWYVVEQDRCTRPPLESARMSIEYLKSRGMV